MRLPLLSKSKKILIYGTGVEGQAAHRFLTKHAPESELVFHNDNIPAYASEKNWGEYEAIILSAGVPRTKIPDSFHNRITSITNIFFENLPEERRQHVIGISGTKGKSTTTKFCHELLNEAGFKTAIGGNYGIGLLDLYDQFIDEDYTYAVIELSSYQLEFLPVSPGIAIFLNLYQDHIDRHGNIENYFNAKSNLWLHQKPNDLLIIPETWHNFANEHQIGTQKQKLIFSKPLDSNYFSADSVLNAPHFLENFGTVAALASTLDISDETIHSTCNKFSGLPHRMEYVGTINSIEFYDDAISTNPDSTLPAVNFFDRRLGSIILGGQDRQQDFTQLLKRLKEKNVYIIIYESETSDKIQKELDKLNYTNYAIIKYFADVVTTALKVTPPNKICLLSTAAPSYDKFKNFEEQGDIFKKLISDF